MGYKLSQGDKILSIVNSGLSISLLVYTYLLKPEYLSVAIIFAIVLVAITIIVLAIRIASQAKRIRVQAEKISNLEDSNRIIKEDLTKTEKECAELKKLLNVPFLDKWPLLYTFMWRNSIPILNNPVKLFEIHVTRRLIGSSKTKDNQVTYLFSGECVKQTSYFRFCMVGASVVPLKKIQFHIMDLTLNQELEYRVLRNTQDSNIKYVEIYFKKPILPKDVFKIELSWTWPKTAFAESDYFSIPNIYSKTTKRLILDLYPTPDMNLSCVETYKFGLCDAEPILVEHLYKNKEGFYRSIIVNPENNADYITYYG